MTGMPAEPSNAASSSLQPSSDEQTRQQPKPLPKGVVLGPDGKPCRSCTDIASWRAMVRDQPSSSGGGRSVRTQAKPSTTSAAVSSSSLAQDSASCPPDVEQLGRSTWTLLHTLTANYPDRPTLAQQTETRQFLGLFGKMYPCWVCAADFRSWMGERGNEPRVSNREEFGKWMCEAHNAVNVKLGKERFDCDRWEERWRSGWKDGSCD